MTQRCVACGAEIIGGEPLHELKVHYRGSITIEHRCRECIETLASALWPEDFGPCPYQHHKAGHE